MAKGTVNKVTIIGRLGKDPEVRYLTNGDAVATLTVATTSQWKDRSNGVNQEHTEWHRIVCFGKLGEIVGQYLRKGSKAYFEGHLRTKKWQDKDGHERYTTEIIANEMQMLDSRSDDSQESAVSGDGNSNHDTDYKSSARSNKPSPTKYKPHTPVPALHTADVAADELDDPLPF